MISLNFLSFLCIKIPIACFEIYPRDGFCYMNFVYLERDLSSIFRKRSHFKNSWNCRHWHRCCISISRSVLPSTDKSDISNISQHDWNDWCDLTSQTILLQYRKAPGGTIYVMVRNIPTRKSIEKLYNPYECCVDIATHIVYIWNQIVVTFSILWRKHFAQDAAIAYISTNIQRKRASP